MNRKSIRAAATKIMRKLNRRKNTAASNHNHCWNAASQAYGYARRGHPGDVQKAKASLDQARSICRPFI